LKLGPAVEFPGPVMGQEKWDLLASASLFIHTSRWEGMPFAVLEALALGRPVVITPETNVGRQVAQYGAGWVVEKSPSAIAAGLRAAMTCEAEQLDKVGQAARELAADCLTWPATAREMLAVYRG
jgi:glycosyltransferase involved in cell wall biosynthesis